MILMCLHTIDDSCQSRAQVITTVLQPQGIFTTDLTLAQIKTLRAKERLPSRDQDYNFLYEVPTLQEYLDVIKNATLLHGRVVGAVPETKVRQALWLLAHPCDHGSFKKNQI